MNIFSVVSQAFKLTCQPPGANVASSMEYDRGRVQRALIDSDFGDRLATIEKGLDTMLYKELTEAGVDDFNNYKTKGLYDELTNVTFPDSVTYIGNFAFDYCESLTTINVKQFSYAHQWCMKNGYGDKVQFY